MSARTKAAKRRRKRTIEAKELPGLSLRPTMALGDVSAWKEAADARAARYQVEPAEAIRPEYGYSLGRMLIYFERDGKITKEQERDYLDAGAHFARVVTAYQKDVLGAPSPNPSAMDMNRIGGRSCAEVTQEEIRAIVGSYMQIVACLDGKGPRNERMHALKELCICDAEWAAWPDTMCRQALSGLGLISDMLKGGK